MASCDPPESSDRHEGKPGLSNEGREIIRELVRSGAFEDALLQADIDDLAILREDLKHKLRARAGARRPSANGSSTALDKTALRALLCECLCQSVGVEPRSDGELMLRTHFKFPDGDSYLFYLSELPSGGLRLSDHGHTLMHISYEHDIDSFLKGSRRRHLERIIGETGVSQSDGAFHYHTTVEDLPAAITAFGQALTRIYDLTSI